MAELFSATLRNADNGSVHSMEVVASCLNPQRIAGLRPSKKACKMCLHRCCCQSATRNPYLSTEALWIMHYEVRLYCSIYINLTPCLSYTRQLDVPYVSGSIGQRGLFPHAERAVQVQKQWQSDQHQLRRLFVGLCLLAGISHHGLSIMSSLIKATVSLRGQK